MKVLFVFNHPAPYKVSFFNELAKELDIFVIFERTKAKDRPDEFYSKNKYNFNHLFLKKGAFSNENSNTSELKNYIKEHYQEYDHIVMNGYSTFTEIKAIKFMNKNNIPFILMINGGIKKEKEFFYKRNLKKKLIGSAKYYLSPSAVSDEYLTYYTAKKKHIFNYPYSTVYQSQIMDNFLPEEEKLKLRKKWDLPDGILYINPAQFIDRKNNLQLIEIFKNRQEKLLLLGNGPLKETYLKYISENNIKNVFIRDFLPKNEALEVMSCCDFHITLSKEDIYGHTIHEALSVGLPVISSEHVIAAKTLLKDGYNGYVVPLVNEEIISKMNSISKEMNYNALTSAKENTIEKSALKVAKILKEDIQ